MPHAHACKHLPFPVLLSIARAACAANVHACLPYPNAQAVACGLRAEEYREKHGLPASVTSLKKSMSIKNPMYEVSGPVHPGTPHCAHTHTHTQTDGNMRMVSNTPSQFRAETSLAPHTQGYESLEGGPDGRTAVGVPVSTSAGEPRLPGTKSVTIVEPGGKNGAGGAAQQPASSLRSSQAASLKQSQAGALKVHTTNGGGAYAAETPRANGGG